MFYLIFFVAYEYLLKMYNSLKVFFTGTNVSEDSELDISRDFIAG